MKNKEGKAELRCAIQGCEEPVPRNNPKDGSDNILPLCTKHYDMLKVVVFGLTHLRVAQMPVQPKIIVPGIQMPKDFKGGLQ